MSAAKGAIQPIQYLRAVAALLAATAIACTPAPQQPDPEPQLGLHWSIQQTGLVRVLLDSGHDTGWRINMVAGGSYAMVVNLNANAQVPCSAIDRCVELAESAYFLTKGEHQ